MRRRGDFPVLPSWKLVMKDLGLDLPEVLCKAGLPEDLFNREGGFMTTPEVIRFWSVMEECSTHEAFPIAIIEAITTETYFPPLFAAMCSPNMKVAVHRIRKFRRLLTPQNLEVEEKTDGSLKLRYEWRQPVSDVPGSFEASQLLFLLKLARTGTRHQIVPEQLIVTNEMPLLDRYTKYVGTQPIVGDKSALILSEEDAHRPFVTSNPELWKSFEPDLRRRLNELDEASEIDEQVHASLLELLPSGVSSLEQVAEKLKISKRTLQRRLEKQGTSFQDILNKTRESLARHYLATTAMSTAEMAYLLGYKEPNSFFRAFHEWTGMSPDELRRASSQAARKSP